MGQRIKVTSKPLPRIRVTSQPLERIDPDYVAKALGAERLESGVPESVQPQLRPRENGRGSAKSSGD